MYKMVGLHIIYDIQAELVQSSSCLEKYLCSEKFENDYRTPRVGKSWATGELRGEFEANCLANRSAFPLEVDIIPFSEMIGGKVDCPKF